MMKYLRDKIKLIYSASNERTRKIFRNILLSFGVKGGSIVINLSLVPLMINYISPVQYGIWLTISSIVSWMSFFDVGLGHGLRNKLANALAVQDFEEAKKFVSTTYASLSIISVLLFLLILIVTPLINWRDLLNIPSSVDEDIEFIVLLVLCSFCVQFVVQIINTVLTANQESARASLIAFLGQLGMLLTILIIKRTVPGSLTTLVWALTLIPLTVLLLSTFFYYRTKLRHIAPSLKKINFKYAKSIMNLGGAFFIIQVSALILFQTNNFIIIKVIGPESVTKFNVAFKFFSIITMLFMIIVTPYWSAFTDAYAKGDVNWMKRNMNLLRRTFYALSSLAFLLFLMAPYLYEKWLGGSINIEPSLSFSMLVYVIAHMWQTLHVFFLNGIGRIRLQMYAISLGAVINLPLAIYLGRIWGLSGIISATSIVFIFLGTVYYLQSQKTIENTDTGLWSK